MQQPRPAGTSTPLRPGDLVEVLSQQELFATVDAEGKCQGLPLMPEMLKYCGQRFRVYRRAEKVYHDMHHFTGRLAGTVILDGPRCDGAAHEGCQMACRILWKEVWLRRVDDRSVSDVPSAMNTLPLVQLTRATRQGDKFSCQATELIRCAERRLPWWDLRQYVRDYVVGGRTVGQLLLTIFLVTRNKIRYRLGLPLYGALRGRQKKTPQVSLQLQPGELVRVKSREEIEATLDDLGRNRGLAFADDMLRFCGGVYRVAQRVDQAVVEWTGELRRMSDTVALDGVYCSGIHQQACPRGCYHLWREAWLSRAPDPQAASTVSDSPVAAASGEGQSATPARKGARYGR